MLNKKSFLIHFDKAEVFNELTDEQAGQLIKSICNYALDLKTQSNPMKPNGLSGLLKAIASPFYSTLDNDFERWHKRCEANKNNGGKGGRPPKKKPNQTEKNPIKPDTDTDTDTDTVLDKSKDLPNNTPLNPPGGKKPIEKIPYEEIQKIWNEAMEGTPIAKTKILTEKRKRAIKKIWKPILEEKINIWQECCQKVRVDGFYRGETGNRNWKADFDFITREDIIVKVIEKSNQQQTPSSQTDFEELKKKKAEYESLLVALRKQRKFFAGRELEAFEKKELEQVEKDIKRWEGEYNKINGKLNGVGGVSRG